jgi:hypothetical protein
MPDSTYQPQSIDTSVESDHYQFELLRQKTTGERFAMAAQMIRWAKTVSLRGIQKARGKLAPEYFARAVLQEKWIPLLTPFGDASMWIQDQPVFLQGEDATTYTIFIETTILAERQIEATA